MRSFGIVVRRETLGVALAAGVFHAVTAAGLPPPPVLLGEFAPAARCITVVPAAAHTEGLEGTTWRTDLELHNPGSSSVSGYLFFLKTARNNSDAVGELFDIDPGASLRLSDVVSETFGETRATGAILLGSDGQLVVTSRTFNDDQGGTYGQYIEGCADTDALATGEVARLTQLVQNADFRTNLGIANAGSTGFYADVDFYRDDGRRLGSTRYWLGPFMHLQDGEVLTAVTSEDVDDAYAVVATSNAGARYFAYASVVDNRSGDPIAIPARVPEPAPCSYTIDPTSRFHGAGAETGSFTIEAPADCAWAPTPSALWIQLTGRPSGSGNGILSYRVEANHEAASRTGTIEVPGAPSGQTPPAGVEGQTFTVTQAGQECSYAVEPTGRSHGAAAETGSFAVAAPSGCTWTASSTASWIEVTAGIGGDGNGTVSYRVEANTHPSQRTGTILVHDTPFTITQAGLECSYALDPTGRSHGAGVETGSFTVTAPSGCTWTASSSGSWIEVTAGAAGDGNGTVSYRVEANAHPSQRTGTILVHDVPFTITQAPVAEITVTLPGGVPLVLVPIPAGTFRMGSPSSERGRSDDETPHQVTLTQGYSIGKYEITQRQWVAVMGSNPSSGCGDHGIGDDYPVYCVTWFDVCGGTTGSDCGPDSFIGRLNAHLGTTTFRLPTEAEWEYAARAGTATEFSFPASPDWNTDCGSFPEAEAHMWWCGNAGDMTHPVGQKAPNPWGLHDVHGNVWEWVADWYDSYPSSPVSDPTGPATPTDPLPDRIVRGGGFPGTATSCRSACRARSFPSFFRNHTGFRLARSP